MTEPSSHQPSRISTSLFHDLMNGRGVIRMSGQLIESRTGDPDAVERLAKKIVENVVRMRALIDETRELKS